MNRIAIVSPSPLWAGGVAAALNAQPDWRVQVQEDARDSDAAVLHAQVAADALRQHAALPSLLPTVWVGDDLRELAARSGAEPRALALLAADATPAQLRAALLAVLAGLSVRDPAAEPWRAPEAAPALDHEPLTPRELEVFELVGKGLSNRDIGGVLGISAHTAKYHVGQILAKVGAATRAEAVSLGLRLGLIGL
jgi:DNA-binding NarL/FixJ family response regulator